MALSSMIGRISSRTLKAQSLKNLGNLLTKPSSAVTVTQLPYHSRSNENQLRDLCDTKKYVQPLTFLPIFAKQFSTSSVRLSAHQGHDHSKIWRLERFLSVVLLPLTPAALIYPCQQLDIALAFIIVVHTHFGLEAIVVDYIRPILFGDLAPKVGLFLLYLFSVATFAGLMHLILNDVGLANTILMMWKK